MSVNESSQVFDLGDYVEITQNRRGVIKYEGNIQFVGYMIGLELDERIPGGTDGLLLNVRYFKCGQGRATFVKPSKIKRIIKPKSSTNRIRKALNLPISRDDGDDETTSKKKLKTRKKKHSKKNIHRSNGATSTVKPSIEKPGTSKSASSHEASNKRRRPAPLSLSSQTKSQSNNIHKRATRSRSPVRQSSSNSSKQHRQSLQHHTSVHSTDSNSSTGSRSSSNGSSGSSKDGRIDNASNIKPSLSSAGKRSRAQQPQKPPKQREQQQQQQQRGRGGHSNSQTNNVSPASRVRSTSTKSDKSAAPARRHHGHTKSQSISVNVAVMNAMLLHDEDNISASLNSLHHHTLSSALSPHTPRPTHASATTHETSPSSASQGPHHRRRATSSMAIKKNTAAASSVGATWRKKKSRHHRRKDEDDDDEKAPAMDVNEKLKYYLHTLQTTSALRQRQEALKQCVSILSDRKLTKQASSPMVFSFDGASAAATADGNGKGHENKTRKTSSPCLDSLTLKQFVESFKKPFLKQIEDRHASIQKQGIDLLHAILKHHWLYAKKSATYYAKKLLAFLERNDIKSARDWVDPVLKLVVKSLNYGDDKHMAVMMIAELVQFATKSRSKMVRKHCWTYIGVMIKKQIKYQQELPSASSSSPSYAIGGSSNKIYSFNTSPHNMLDLLDLLQSGLKKGIADSDKSAQSEAMNVLTSFSILDETRAERLISRMSGSLIRQYRKHEASGSSTAAAQSPRINLGTNSPRASFNISPKDRSAVQTKKKDTASKAKAKTASALMQHKKSSPASSSNSAKKNSKEQSPDSLIPLAIKAASVDVVMHQNRKPEISINSLDKVFSDNDSEDVRARSKSQQPKQSQSQPNTSKASQSKSDNFQFTQATLSLCESDNQNFHYEELANVDADADDTKEVARQSSSDEASSSDSGDSNDSEDQRVVQTSANKRPSVITNIKGENDEQSGNMAKRQNAEFDDDDDTSDTDDDDDDDDDEEDRRPAFARKRKRAFAKPILDTSMSKNSSIYDRNTNVKKNSNKMAGLARPSSAKFSLQHTKNSPPKQQQQPPGFPPVRARGSSQPVVRPSSARPSSGRASDGDIPMFQIAVPRTGVLVEYDDDELTPKSMDTPTSVGSGSHSDSASDSNSSASLEADDPRECDDDDDDDSDDDDDDDDDEEDDGIMRRAMMNNGVQKDISAFRQHIENGYMPKSAALSHVGLLNEYEFDLKPNQRRLDGAQKSALFSPSFCYGRVNKEHILQSLPYPMMSDDSDEDEEDDEDSEDDDADDAKRPHSAHRRRQRFEHYVCVEINTNLQEKEKEQHFVRHKLNVVILLDQSVSMGSTFLNDHTANNATRKSKIAIANECICNVLDMLQDDDRFALISFDDQIYVHTAAELKSVRDIDRDALKQTIMGIKENGGTNFELAYEKANELFARLFEDQDEDDDSTAGGSRPRHDNRIVLLTDAAPNITATDQRSLGHLYRTNCMHETDLKRIYTTFIGVGLDLPSEMAAEITQYRGCNFYSVQSKHDFETLLNREFDNIMTPLVFNVSLALTSDADEKCIADVYGVSSKRRKRVKQSGQIHQIGSLFPVQYQSSAANRNSRGCVIVKINTACCKDLKLRVQYEDRNGNKYENVQPIVLTTVEEDHPNDEDEDDAYFDNASIRKGILLCRFCSLLKCWMDEDVDMQQHHARSFLNVSQKWKKIFTEFVHYFQQEMAVIGDAALAKEMELLRKLVAFQKQIHKTKNQKSEHSNLFNSPPRTIAQASNPPQTASPFFSPHSVVMTPTEVLSPRGQAQSDTTDLIITFLDLPDPGISWKMMNFLSNEPTTNIFMSFLSRMPSSLNIEDKACLATLQSEIDYDAQICDVDTPDLYSTDSNEIRLTQLSYSLMRVLSNENSSEPVKSLLARKCSTICLHALAVFHPQSTGNAYHARVILESLLTCNPKELFQCLTSDKSIAHLLKFALFRNIHKGNMNSFCLDLICYRCPSPRKLYKQQTQIHQQKLLQMLAQWQFIPYVLTQCHANVDDDNICSKFSTFFIDLAMRCASNTLCSVLFQAEHAALIVDELVGNGLLDTGEQQHQQHQCSVWTRVQCTQTLITFMDICSRPSVLEQVNSSHNNQMDASAVDDRPNILHPLFAALLQRLQQYIPELAQLVIHDEQYLAAMPTTHGVIARPFGQIKLNGLELLTVAADFAQFECGQALAKIPITFFKDLLILAFVHSTNNFFLVHFRRLLHLSMIFRRRILKYLFLEQRMLARLIESRNSEHVSSDLSAYAVQMLFDYYEHDKAALEKEQQADTVPNGKPHHRQYASNNSASTYEGSDNDDDDDDDEHEEQLRANFSTEPDDQWSIAEYFDSSEVWLKHKATVIETVAQTVVVADVPNWDMGQSSKLDDLISSLLRAEEEDDTVMQEPFREKIENGQLPSMNQVSYHSVLNEYEFVERDDATDESEHPEEQKSDNCTWDSSLLCSPSFTFARSQIPAELVRAHGDDGDAAQTDMFQYFLKVDLHVKGIEQRRRNKLNLVLVLDQSESMGNHWNLPTSASSGQYGVKPDLKTRKTKIESTVAGVAHILRNLQKDDRVGVVTFDRDVHVQHAITGTTDRDDQRLMTALNDICAKYGNSASADGNGNNDDEEHPSVLKSGVDFDAAFDAATNLFDQLFQRLQNDTNEYDNRILFISDYLPQNMSFVNLIKTCSEYTFNERICTSFVAVGGCSLNSLFMDQLLRNRGFNYYAPSTPQAFIELTTNQNAEFDGLVTPLIYDLCLTLKSPHKDHKTLNCFTHIYGIKNESKQKTMIQCGEIYKNDTLFLSHRAKTNGCVLIELNNQMLRCDQNQHPRFDIRVEISFEDRDSRFFEDSQQLSFPCHFEHQIDYFENVCVRKAILLQRFIKLLKQRIEDDAKLIDSQSIEGTKWKKKLQKFIAYFQQEMSHCHDDQLVRELNVLQKLSNF